MKRGALLSVLFCVACSGAGVRIPFTSLHANAVHRFFPDLDRRENAVRYGRWNALESAWLGGVTPAIDRALADGFHETLRRLPDFPPDPRLCAPIVAREDPAVFEALVEADRFERRVADALAASDATPENTAARIEKSLFRYRRSRFALESPSAAPVDEKLGEFVTARLLLSGDWLFAHAAEDLAVAEWRDQRWKVKSTVDQYDHRVDSPPATIEASWYRTFAPTFTASYGAAADIFDRATRFRIELFEALTAPGDAARREAVRAVARRYGIER